MPWWVRRPFKALWDLDLAFADVVSTSSDPSLGTIRLAWWRERLEELDEGKEPPAEPRLREVAFEVIPRGVTGDDLSKLEDAWQPLLSAFPWGADQAIGLKLRGHILFGIGARLLEGDPKQAEAAGALWSLVDGARHCSDLHSRIDLMKEARRAIDELPREQPPKHLRRLTGLAAMAAHDALRDRPLDLPYESAGRGVAAFLHYMRGTLPRG